MKKIILTGLFLFSFTLVIAQHDIFINLPDEIVQLMINQQDDKSVG